MDRTVSSGCRQSQVRLENSLKLSVDSGEVECQRRSAMQDEKMEYNSLQRGESVGSEKGDGIRRGLRQYLIYLKWFDRLKKSRRR